MEQKKKTFHEELKELMDEYAHKVYDCTRNFPKDEIFGLTSQLKRASLSVVLNYIEGYARQRDLVLKNFLEISYRSLKESKYLIYFSFRRKYLEEKEYAELIALAERIGKMLWGTLSHL